MSLLPAALLRFLRRAPPLQLAVGSLLAAAALARVVSVLRSRAARKDALSRGTLVIIGASQGIGASLSRLLGRTFPHAHLVLCARTGPLLDALKTEVDATRGPSPRGRVSTFVLDATDGAAVARVARSVGPAAALVSCAGVGEWRAAYERDATPASFERCLGAPLLSTLLAAHAFVPAMVRANAGTVLALQSPASRAPWPGATAYTAARWGLRGALEALRLDCDASAPGVRVCEVVLTEISDSAYFDANPGSRERLPWIAPLFGRLTCDAAAAVALDALLSGRETTTAPAVLRLSLATLPLPGVAAVFRALLGATGWRRGSGTVLADEEGEGGVGEGAEGARK